jgi:hypothetical protein
MQWASAMLSPPQGTARLAAVHAVILLSALPRPSAGFAGSCGVTLKRGFVSGTRPAWARSGSSGEKGAAAGGGGDKGSYVQGRGAGAGRAQPGVGGLKASALLIPGEMSDAIEARVPPYILPSFLASPCPSPPPLSPLFLEACVCCLLYG